MMDDVVDETEVEADDAAAASAAGVRPLVLASALVSVASWVAADGTRGATTVGLLPGAVGFTSCDLLSRRVLRLAGEAPLVVTHVTRRSVLAAVAALVLVWTSGVMVAHPLAAQRPVHTSSPASRMSSSALPSTTTVVDMDCTRHSALALLHIFCPEHPTSCPHDI